MTNSYMSPHGTRCTASPRVTTPMMCRARPAVVRMRAIRTRRPLHAGGPAGPAAGRPAGRPARVRRRPRHPGPAQCRGAACPACGAQRRPRPAATARAGARRDRASALAPAPAPRADGAAPPEGEVAREREHRQGVDHDGDIRKWSLRWARPWLIGHQSDSPSVVVGELARPSAVAGAGLRAGCGAAPVRWPGARGQAGELLIEASRRVGAGQAAHVDHGGAVRARAGPHEDPAAPDEEGQEQAGQRRQPGDQRGQLPRVVGDGQADPLPVAGEGERPGAVRQLDRLAGRERAGRDRQLGQARRCSAGTPTATGRCPCPGCLHRRPGSPGG